MTYPLLKKQMSKNIKNVWQLRTLTSLVVFIFLFLGSAYFLKEKNWFSNWQFLTWLGLAIFVALAHFISFLMVNYRYTYHRYEIEEKDVAIQEGYWNRSTTYVPFSRIQHLESDQGIFLRKNNLVSLTISTAATEHVLSGLTVEEAEALKKQIMNLIKVDKEDV